MGIKFFTIIINSNNNIGTLSKVTNAFYDHKINISSICTSELDSENEFKILIEIYSNTSYSQKILEVLSKLEEINKVLILAKKDLIKKNCSYVRVNYTQLMDQ
jgi:acetolactate synthase-1/3 small subunit